MLTWCSLSFSENHSVPATLSSRVVSWPTRLRFALEKIYELDPDADHVALVELRAPDHYYPSPGSLQRHAGQSGVTDREEDVWSADQVAGRWIIRRLLEDGSWEIVYVQPPAYEPAYSTGSMPALTRRQ